MENVRLAEQLCCYCKMELNIFFYLPYFIRDVYKGHGVKVGPGPLDPGPQDSGTPQILKVGPRSPLKFISGIPGPLSKFKSGTPHLSLMNSFFSFFFIDFLLTYFCDFFKLDTKNYQL